MRNKRRRKLEDGACKRQAAADLQALCMARRVAARSYDNDWESSSLWNDANERDINGFTKEFQNLFFLMFRSSHFFFFLVCDHFWRKYENIMQSFITFCKAR